MRTRMKKLRVLADRRAIRFPDFEFATFASPLALCISYTDAIESLLSQSVILPPELLIEIENFIEKKKGLGFTTKEEFSREAAR